MTYACARARAAEIRGLSAAMLRCTAMLGCMLHAGCGPPARSLLRNSSRTPSKLACLVGDSH
eukprot:366301-Chlamydomonas_euryale.AAC.20